jgi:hypothetical protein
VIGTQEKLPGVVPALTVSNHEIPEASSEVWAAICASSSEGATGRNNARLDRRWDLPTIDFVSDRG